MYGGAYDVSPSTSTAAMTPMTVVEAFSPAPPSMRPVFYDSPPRSLAAGAVLDRRLHIFGGTTGGENWLNTCFSFDVDNNVCKWVRGNKTEWET
jgi:hypothetical protein